jgi:flagellar motor switch protein FliM
MENSQVTLSEEEIAMLKDGGDLDSYVDVVKHDLAAEDVSIGFNDAALDMINERFSRQLRAGLVDVLRTTPKIQIEKVSTMKYQRCLQEMKAPLSVNTIKIDPLRGYSLIIIDPSVIFSSLDNFFGGFGKGIGDLPPGRLFTPTESSIIKILLNLIFASLKDAWSPVLKLDFTEVAAEINPQFAQIADENDQVIVSKFNLNLGQNVDGAITIIQPFISLKPIRDLLRSRIQTSEENDDKAVKWSNDLQVACKDASMELQIKLAEIPTSLAKLKSLREGDVIMFNKPDLAWGQIEGFTLFDMEVGTIGNNVAAKIINFRKLKKQGGL